MEQSSTPVQVDWIGLPDLVWLVVAKALDQRGKRSLMATSRRLAQIVHQSVKRVHLNMTQEAKWQGIRQVLKWACNVLWDFTNVPAQMYKRAHPQSNVSWLYAWQYLLAPTPSGITSVNDCFPGVLSAKVHWRETLTPWLLVTTCPNIATFAVEAWSSPLQSPNIQPLMRWTSVTHFEYLGYDLLPDTALELADHMPNVTSLTALHRISVFLPAWGKQLLRLETLFVKGTDSAQQLLQPCSCLQKLVMRGGLGFESSISVPACTSALTELQVLWDVTDTQFQQMLQLPALKHFTFRCKKELQQDYSQHNCGWETLTLDASDNGIFKIVCYVNLSQLPLRNLKSIRFKGDYLYFRLPDPSKPNTVQQVQRAADNLKSAGRVKFVRSNEDSNIDAPVP